MLGNANGAQQKSELISMRLRETVCDVCSECGLRIGSTRGKGGYELRHVCPVKSKMVKKPSWLFCLVLG